MAYLVTTRRLASRLVSGGPDQVRTDDLLNAIEALFQLSYEPIHLCEGKKGRFFRAEGKEFLTAQG